MKTKHLLRISSTFFVVLLIFTLSSARATPPKNSPPSQRIVTLTPALAELVTAIGVPESEIVGVSEYTDFPESLRTTKTVGSYARVNLEIVLSLKPDIVLASQDGTAKETVDRLRALKLKVQVIPAATLAEIRNSFDRLGRLLGHEKEAAAAMKTWDQKVEGFRVREKKRNLNSGEKRPRVLLQVGESPLIVAGGKNFLSEGLELLGAENVYAGVTQAYPRVSFEDVLEKNPDSILLLVSSDSKAQMKNAENRWKRLKNLKAVQNHQVHSIESDDLGRPGPRFLVGLLELERAIFPDIERK